MCFGFTAESYGSEWDSLLREIPERGGRGPSAGRCGRNVKGYERLLIRLRDGGQWPLSALARAGHRPDRSGSDARADRGRRR